jgi:hypothetical protein
LPAGDFLFDRPAFLPAPIVAFLYAFQTSNSAAFTPQFSLKFFPPLPFKRIQIHQHEV